MMRIADETAPAAPHMPAGQGRGPASRKRAIAAAFGAATAAYEDNAPVQREAAETLAAQIAALTLPQTPRLLEIGCGTGLLTRALSARLPGARALITDISEPMLRACRATLREPGYVFAAMDGEAPALGEARFDLICASLAFQWFEDQPAAIARLASLLAPSGVLAFATLGQNSLADWRSALTKAGAPAPVPDWPDPEPALAALPGVVRIHRTTITQPHSSGLAFLAGLRAIGAQTPRAGHAPVPPATLRRAITLFERDAAATASYEIIYALYQAP